MASYTMYSHKFECWGLTPNADLTPTHLIWYFENVRSCILSNVLAHLNLACTTYAVGEYTIVRAQNNVPTVSILVSNLNLHAYFAPSFYPLSP